MLQYPGRGARVRAARGGTGGGQANDKVYGQWWSLATVSEGHPKKWLQ